MLWEGWSLWEGRAPTRAGTSYTEAEEGQEEGGEGVEWLATGAIPGSDVNLCNSVAAQHGSDGERKGIVHGT